MKCGGRIFSFVLVVFYKTHRNHIEPNHSTRTLDYSQAKRPLIIGMEFLIGGLAATSAGVFTNPLEVVKHHMEISKKSQFNNKYGRFFHTGLTVAKQDGLKSLQKGLSPALGAYLISYGMKLGTYHVGHGKGLTTNSEGGVAVPKSVLTSCAGGLLGQYLSNPFYLLKYEHEKDTMQYNASSKEKKNVEYLDTIKRIYREHGIRGFFRGATASLPRAFIGTSQLTSFAVAKEGLNKYEAFRSNPFYATFLASIVAGFVLSMAMTPFELVLTKMYKQAIGAKSSERPYSGYLDCMRKIYQRKGLKPFYRGMGPIYLKLGPHTVLCLVFWEELKGIYDNNNESANIKNGSTVNNNIYKKFGFTSYDNEDNATEYLSTNFSNDEFDNSGHNVYWN